MLKPTDMRTERDTIGPGLHVTRPDRKRSRTISGAIAVSIFLLALFIGPRWIYWEHLQLNPDAMSYWDVGRSLAHGHGLVWNVKPYFYPDDGQVVKPAVGYLSVPFTLLLGLLEALGCGFRSAAVLIGLLTLIDAALVYQLARRWSGWPIATAATGLFLLYPEMVYASTTLWTEPMALVFMLGAYLIAARSIFRRDDAEPARNRVEFAFWPSSWCGALLGLGYLTRPADIVYFVAIAGVALLFNRKRDALAVTGGMLAVITPYWIADWRINGSPGYTMYSLLYRTLFYGNAMYTGFEAKYGSAIGLLRHHEGPIFGEIVRNAHLCERILLTPYSLGPLLCAAAAAGLLVLSHRFQSAPVKVEGRPAPRSPDPVASAMIAGAIMNLALSSLVWSTHEEARFMLGTWVLLLIGSLSWLGIVVNLELRKSGMDQAGVSRGERSAGMEWRGLTALTILVAAIVITVAAETFTLCRDAAAAFPYHSLSWRENEVEIYRPLCAAIDRSSSTTAVVAASDPWIVNYLSQRPTVLFPALRRGELLPFLLKYRPAWIVADPGRMPSRGVGGDFTELANRSWFTRDWKLRQLRQSPYLQLFMLSHRSGARLYRVALPDKNQADTAAMETRR